MSDSRLDYLFNRYFDKTATPEERTEFMQHIVRLKSEDPLLKLMEEVYHADQSPLAELDTQLRDRVLFNIFKAPQSKAYPLYPVWIKYAAVLFCILFGASWYFYQQKDKNAVSGLASASHILPGGNKAVLTLGNGKKIVLDAAGTGLLAQQGNIFIRKTTDGQLVYDIKGTDRGEPSTNSIETPNGGQYQINLPDGTRVWLNAASSLKYPTLFTGRERRVELKGEAYFEVSKDASKPFRIQLSNESEVQVLGTHFNIDAYQEAPSIKATLLEGSVIMKSGKHSEKLIPGQQAQTLKNNHQISVVDKVDINEVLAWKNGFFSYGSISLQVLMQQVEKWYDVKVMYADPVQAEFVGRFPKNIPLSELLRLLELTKKVHFKTEGKTITIMK
eukprot:gene13811-16279_t